MSKKRNKKKSKNKRRRTGIQSMEWIIGRLTMPFYITEDQPFRPEMFLCLELPSGVIVKHSLIDPNGPLVTVTDVLEEAFESPSAGPPRRPRRIRLDSHQMAEQIRDKHPEIDVVVGPTPELDEVLETFEESQPFRETEPSYLEEGRVSKEAAESFFRAAETLYRVAPWRWVGDTQLIQVDVPNLGFHRGCVSIIGAAGESFGFIIFPSINAFESFLEHTQGPRIPSEKLNLGTSMISVNFERGADLPASLRKEVARYRWPVAGPDAYPWVMCVDEDNLARPLTGRDIQLVEVCASSLASFTAKNREIFEVDKCLQVCETYTNEDDVAVTLTAPCEFDEEDYLDETQPEISGNIKIGRNEPCPCGSGKKYKKCCQQKDDDSRVKANRPASVHVLDDQLVGKMLKFGVQQFGDAMHKAEEDFDPSAETAQLLVPWMVYHFSIEGKPVVDWFVDHERKRLSDREISWLEAQKTAWLSLWEVIDVVPGERITLKDLLTGEERTVCEVQGSRSIRSRHVILARIVDYDDISIIGGSYPRVLSPLDAAEVVRRMKKRLRRKKDVPVDRLRDEKIGRFMIARWEDTILDMDMRMDVPPILQNTDGDDLLLTVDHFRIETKDVARMQERLLAIADTDYDAREKSIVFTREGSGVGSLESVTIGRARIEADRLLVETNSQKRADDLRTHLESKLDQEIRHLMRSHQDPMKGIEDLPEQTVSENELPPEIAAEAILAYKEKHYSTWPDVPLPALGGKTPKEAVRTKQGREQVDLLIKDCENHEAALPEIERYDFSSLRRRLGLCD